MLSSLRSLPRSVALTAQSLAMTLERRAAPAISHRLYTDLVTNERTIQAALTENMNITHLHVVDKSGGCGAMFAIHVVSDDFAGKKLTEQHRMVNSILKPHIQQMHGLSLKTQTPEQFLKESK